MISSKLCWGALAVSLAGCTVEASSVADAERLGETTEDLKHGALNAAQQATALKLIDDICGDTWCEGDHDFSFDRLVCQDDCRGGAGSCELTFRVFSYDTDIESGPTFVRSCRTPGFTGFDSLVQTQAGYQSLEPRYYDALSACISRVENELPR
jgi:hypothetical protein